MTETRPPAIRWWAWWPALLLMVAGVALTFQLFVMTSRGQLLDQWAMNGAVTQFVDSGAWSKRVLTLMPEIVGVTGAVMFVLLTVIRRRWGASAIALAGLAAANLSTQILKRGILIRPELANGVPYYTGNSLPSGHTTFAASAMLAVLIITGSRLRPAMALVGLLFAGAVGLATLVEGWHRPSDMVAAYLVSGFWAVLTGWIAMRIGPRWNSRRPDRGSLAWAGVALAVLGGLAILSAYLCFLAGGGWAAVDDPALRESVWHASFGLLLSGGSATLVFGFVTALMAWEEGVRPRG
ncbi:phosphatase PAP2 family protein [Parenemella sanctibonifatiensis]|uniref:PA-phosphatase n=1 Tax=Parenemella sanctibonifatiensis TaxID=2016505 RepID=A0A255EAF2_9ACTN|nr:phosphatase PAP2 family protein [Parenemella sanctibonifatiensis]OYN87901.1 PA-phosphatase [Parenemella sanctibonifatiensis]